MSDEQIKQRIKYLVEHGGIYDDPIDRLRRQVRWLYVMVGAALTSNVAQIVMELTG